MGGFLVQIEPKSSGGSKTGVSIEDQIKMQISEMEAKLPKPMKCEFDPETASCLHVFRIQEVDRFNSMIVSMKKHMADLKLAIDGKVVMSLMLENMFNAMTIKKIPPN